MLSSATFATDDEPSSWAQEFVENVSEQEILDANFFNGYKNAITRGEFAYLGVKLYEQYTGKTVDIGDANFNDTSDEWAIKAKNAGIVGGYPDGTFKPENNIKRDELAVLFHNVFKAAGVEYIEYEGVPFTDDSEIASWAKESVYVAKANGIISGVGENIFDASGNATKEQSLIMFNKGQTSKTVVSTVEEETTPVEDLEAINYSKVVEIIEGVVLETSVDGTSYTVTVDYEKIPNFGKIYYKDTATPDGYYNKYGYVQGDLTYFEGQYNHFTAKGKWGSGTSSTATSTYDGADGVYVFEEVDFAFVVWDNEGNVIFSKIFDNITKTPEDILVNKSVHSVKLVMEDSVTLVSGLTLSRSIDSTYGEYVEMYVDLEMYPNANKHYIGTNDSSKYSTGYNSYSRQLSNGGLRTFNTESGNMGQSYLDRYEGEFNDLVFTIFISDEDDNIIKSYVINLSE